MTDRTLRSFDSDFRCECEDVPSMGGKEYFRVVVGGEVDGDISGDVVDGDADEGDETSAQAALASGKKPPAGLVQELLFEAMPSLLFSNSGVDDVSGLGLAEGVFAMTERGGRMLKILSSSGGGPYESKGSGTVCNIGSMTGSELQKHGKFELA
jgi:hypothetical protein